MFEIDRAETLSVPSVYRRRGQFEFDKLKLG